MSERRADAASAEPGFTLFLVLLLALTAVRLIGQHFSVVDLDVDEAQYWGWSRALALGYFSKPPLIAWVNAAAGFACGDSIACIRAPAPLFYLGTSLLIYGAADVLYARTAAFWAGLTSALAIGVSFSSRIMTTDVVLLFCWAAALYGYVKLLRGGGWGWTLLLALGIGFGLLAKYAMAYFVLSIFVAALVSRDARALLRSPKLWVAIFVGLAMLAPNIWWNLQNGFATAKATANYARPQTSLEFGDALAFLATQFAVAGPITFAVLLGLFVRFFARDVSSDDRAMLLFALPPLAVVTVNAVVADQANANWAATALISTFVVTSAWLVRGAWWRLLWTSVIIGVVAQAVLLLADPFADRITVPGIAKGDIFRKVLGWRELGAEVGKLEATAGVASVAVEGRAEIATLTYYLRNDTRPLLLWSPHETPTNHFEMVRALKADAPEPILLVTGCADAERLTPYFSSVEPVANLAVATGPISSRSYAAFLLSGNTSPIKPLGDCPH